VCIKPPGTLCLTARLKSSKCPNLRQLYAPDATRSGHDVSPHHWNDYNTTQEMAQKEGFLPVLSAGEDIGWVQNMLGHSSLQMIFTRYYAWIPRKTRKDGAAFLDSIAKKEANEDLQGKENQGNEILVVCRNDTNTTHIQEQENRHPDSKPEVPGFVD
jgi:hypothetical protein